MKFPFNLKFDHNLIVRADAFAAAAHASVQQVRKYTNVPYIEHPRAVAKMIHEAGLGIHPVAAALLHDVVEDTPITNDQIAAEFGPFIAKLVAEVTDVSKKEDGNRETRKAIDRAHLAKASYIGKSIKLADLIDNGSDIVAHDPGFALKYMREFDLLLPVLVEGDTGLYDRAQMMVLANLQLLSA